MHGSNTVTCSVVVHNGLRSEHIKNLKTGNFKTLGEIYATKSVKQHLHINKNFKTFYLLAKIARHNPYCLSLSHPVLRIVNNAMKTRTLGEQNCHVPSCYQFLQCCQEYAEIGPCRIPSFRGYLQTIQTGEQCNL